MAAMTPSTHFSAKSNPANTYLEQFLKIWTTIVGELEWAREWNMLTTILSNNNSLEAKKMLPIIILSVKR